MAHFKPYVLCEPDEEKCIMCGEYLQGEDELMCTDCFVRLEEEI